MVSGTGRIDPHPGAGNRRPDELIHTLEWARIEEFVSGWSGIGRPPADRSALANGFVAKAVLGLTTTVALIERLTVDRALRRICGFSRWKKLPSVPTFSRAFAEFAENRLAERVHEALIKAHLGEELIGHLSRDATAIEARPARPASAQAPAATIQAALPDTPPPAKRGRPRRGEVRAPKLTRIGQQRQQNPSTDAGRGAPRL